MLTFRISRQESSIAVRRVSRTFKIQHVGRRGPKGDKGDPGDITNLPDASATVKGALKLIGDLGGTADSPKIKRTSRFIVAPYGDSRPADYTCQTATGNGVEINQAIVAANALPNGGVVELLDGTFITSTAIMRLPNVHIRGQGIGHTKVGVAPGSAFNIFDMSKVIYDHNNPLTNSFLSDMEIDGSGMDPASANKGVNGGNFKNSKLYRLYVHDATATGIGDDDFYGTTIDQCTTENNGYTNKRLITAASWSLNVFTFTTSTPHGYMAWAQATGMLTASGTISDGDTVVIGGLTYTFKIALTGASYEVLINGSIAAALVNLKSAVNLTGTIGTDYGIGTVALPGITATTITSNTLAFVADNYGASGNAFVTTTTGANLSWDAITLTGGVSGNKIAITGMTPPLYNGIFNVTSIIDANNFTVSTANNSTNLNLGLDPGMPTTFGCSSDSIIGHNGIGIASGALNAEACIVTNCFAIGNQDNNFLIEADSNNSGATVSYLFSNCTSINAGNTGFQNTGSQNAQFNNCFDYGSLIGGQASEVSQNRTITAASWSAGVATITTSSAHGYTPGIKVSVSTMIPAAYNGYYTVQSTPTATTYTVNIASDPGTAIYFGNSTYTIHPVDGSSFNSPVFANNVNYGINLPSDGVMVKNPVIKDSYNYGARIISSSYTQLEGVRIYGSGRQGVVVATSSGVTIPMTHVKISGFIYNNGKRFANIDGVDVAPSATAPIQNLTIDAHVFDDQDTKTQRYGVILRSSGTLSNIVVRGTLGGNATAPILVQNNSSTIYVSDVAGVNPNGSSDLGNITGSTTFDSSIANFFTGTLTGNISAVMPNSQVEGTKMTWVLAQDPTGSRTLSLPANAVTGTPLTLSTAANVVDLITWAYDSTTSKWRLVSKSLANTSVGTLNNLTITTPNGNNTTSLSVTQNDTTNNPDAEDITNAGTSNGLKINQTGVLAASKYAMFIDSSAAQINAALVRLRQNSASSTQATLQLDNAGSGSALTIASGNMSMAAGTNFTASTVTGTKLGLSTLEKWAFYAATPIVQPGATTDLGTVLSNLGLRAAGTAYPITTSAAVSLGATTVSSLVVGSLSGVLKASTGTVSGSATLNDLGAPSADFSMGSHKLTSVTDPSLAQDAATKAYVDSGTKTVTNTRITKRIETLTDAATVTPASDSYDGGKLLTLSQGTTIANPTGTPTAFQQYILRIKSSSTQSLTWDTQFRGSTDTPLPSATSGSGLTDYLGFQWNSDDSKWDFLALNKGF